MAVDLEPIISSGSRRRPPEVRLGTDGHAVGYLGIRAERPRVRQEGSGRSLNRASGLAGLVLTGSSQWKMQCEAASLAGEASSQEEESSPGFFAVISG